MCEKDAVDGRLFEALTSLVRDQPIDRISVLDITHRAGISRSTFYRYYYDKYQLVNARYNRALDRTLYRFSVDLSWRDATGAIYREIKSDLPYYRNALSSRDTNSLRNHIFRISKAFHLSVLERNRVDVRNWKVERVMESYIYGNLEVMCLWIKDGMVEPIPEMQEVLDMGIPHQFAPYFIQPA